VSISPSPESEVERPPRAGLALPLDIVIAPERAFARIEKRPEWLAAYAVYVVLGLTTVAMLGPVLVRIGALFSAVDPTAALQAPTARETLIIATLEQLITPLIMIGLSATALTVIARLNGSQAPYKLFVALAANCLVPQALGDLLRGTIVWLREPASIADLHSYMVALPDNLAVFAGANNTRELEFLGSFDLFYLWSFVLLAFGFARFAKVRLWIALSLAFALDFVFARVLV